MAELGVQPQSARREVPRGEIAGRTSQRSQATMEYRKPLSPPVLTSAAALFEKLNSAGICYGVFKSSRNIAAALAGDQDLDVLVAREDYRRFCTIASECAGIRSVNHRSLVSPGREDWLVPDFHRVKYLHLDVHTEIRLGGKFDKRYPCYRYEDIRHWNRAQFGTCSIPIVSVEEEARITFSRIAFRVGTIPLRGWRKLKGGWARELDELLFSIEGPGERKILFPTDGADLQCRARKSGGEILVCRRDLARVRRLVRTRCAASHIAMIADPIRNALSACRYTASRLMCQMAPGSVVDRRRPVSGGLLLALIAPDGMGKTTQVNRMSSLYGWKFSCAMVYLGSGDGGGWWPRRVTRAFYIRRRSRIRGALSSDGQSGNPSRSFGSRAAPLLHAFWGILVALERYASVRRAKRMADRGIIVFCDRWPQAIEPGIMDGPTPPRRGRAAGWLRKWELSLYDRMAQFRPDIIVQLTGDYATSAARKPGGITREEFERRIAFMVESRRREPGTCVLDAGRDIDEVSRSLFKLIWSKL